MTSARSVARGQAPRTVPPKTVVRQAVATATVVVEARRDDVGMTQRGEEQGLVNSTLEDGDAQLHALGDHFPALEACFAGQLGGRQVNCHRRVSSYGNQVKAKLARPADALK